MALSFLTFRDKLQHHSGLAEYTREDKIELFSLFVILVYWCALELRSEIAGHGSLIYHTLQFGWVSSAVLGCGILLLRPLNIWTRLAVLTLAGVVSMSARALDPSLFRGEIQSFAFSLAAVAVVTQVTLLAAGFRDLHSERRRCLIRGMLLIGGVGLGSLHGLSLGRLDPTYDAGLFNFDQHLYVRIPSIAMYIVDTVPLLHSFVFFVYSNIPAAVALFDALRGRTRSNLSMTLLFLLSGYIGYLCYHIVPSVGPPFFDPDYYDRFAATKLFLRSGTCVLNAGQARNCMPSLHATWAYLFLLNVSSHDRAISRAVIRAVALFTILGALTAGEHWFLDLVVALPFTVSVNSFFGKGLWPSKPQVLIGFVGVILVFAWFGAILNSSFAKLPMGLAWSAVAATCLGSLFLFWVSSRHDTKSDSWPPPATISPTSSQIR